MLDHQSTEFEDCSERWLPRRCTYASTQGHRSSREEQALCTLPYSMSTSCRHTMSIWAAPLHYKPLIDTDVHPGPRIDTDGCRYQEGKLSGREEAFSLQLSAVSLQLELPTHSMNSTNPTNALYPCSSAVRLPHSLRLIPSSVVFASGAEPKNFSSFWQE